MNLPLTRDTLAAAYDYLCTTLPYSKWNLPDSEDVIFRVARDRTNRGWYRRVGKQHSITISRGCVGWTDSLMRTMAHEMIHLHEQHAGACGAGEHSAAFNRWSSIVCKVHGWDPLLF
jgi:hypothetical protein